MTEVRSFDSRFDSEVVVALVTGEYLLPDLCLIPLESIPIPESIPFLAEVESESIPLQQNQAGIRIGIRVARLELESESIPRYKIIPTRN